MKPDGTIRYGRLFFLIATLPFIIAVVFFVSAIMYFFPFWIIYEGIVLEEPAPFLLGLLALYIFVRYCARAEWFKVSKFGIRPISWEAYVIILIYLAAVFGDFFGLLNPEVQQNNFFHRLFVASAVLGIYGLFTLKKK